jgi:uncharacterized membrane protein YkoI
LKKLVVSMRASLQWQPSIGCIADISRRNDLVVVLGVIAFAGIACVVINALDGFVGCRVLYRYGLQVDGAGLTSRRRRAARSFVGFSRRRLGKDRQAGDCCKDKYGIAHDLVSLSRRSRLAATTPLSARCLLRADDDRQQIDSFDVRQVVAMKGWLKRMGVLVLVLAGLVLAGPLPARADDDGDDDHDRARDLYERGEIKGLAAILDVVRAKAPGDVVAVELIRRADRWVYRFQIVGADGRRKTVEVDAGAGIVLRDGDADR